MPETGVIGMAGSETVGVESAPKVLRSPSTGGFPRERSTPRESLMRRALVITDFTSVALGIWLIFLMRAGHVSDAIDFSTLLVLATCSLPLAKLLGLYDRDDARIRHDTLDEVPRLLATCLGISLAAELLGLIDSSAVTFTAEERLIGILVVTATMMLGRAACRRIVVKATPPERCLIISSDATAATMKRRFERARTYSAVITDRLTIAPELLKDTEDARNRLVELVKSHGAERVIISPESQHDLDSLRALVIAGVNVSIDPHFTDVIGSSWLEDDLSGMTLLGVRRPGLNNSSMIVKRTVDLVLATLGLLVLLPVMVLIAIAIKLDSPGPIIYRQRRVGRWGHEFTIYKFRSMSDGAHRHRTKLGQLNQADKGLFKIDGDPRITRVGSIIRKTGFDEAPQLLNVIGGSMSLVGPRPLVPEEDANLSGWARFRETIPPGITGPWQIGGSSRIPIDEMASLDYRYATNWTPWLDVKILVRTVIYALNLRGQ